MSIFLQNFPLDAQLLIRNLLLNTSLLAVMMLPIIATEGCVKRPSLEPSPSAAPQQSFHP